MTPDPIEIRTAEEPELPTVLSILDAAMLEADVGVVRDRLGGGVLVAVEADRILGTCVIEVDPVPSEVAAIAVRPRRRGQGIGTVLIDAALDRWGDLVAEFDENARPFYASLGFEIEQLGDGRCRGVRRPGQ